MCVFFKDIQTNVRKIIVISDKINLSNPRNNLDFFFFSKLHKKHFSSNERESSSGKREWFYIQKEPNILEENKSK